MIDGIVQWTCLIVISSFLIYYVYKTEDDMKNYILAKNCTKVKGNFAVNNGFVSQDVLMTCYDGNTKCVFNQINSLSQAIKICDINNLCDAFSYNSLNRVMSIIKVSNNIAADENTDIYVRQTQ
jgi:hypothetical protein